MKVKKVYKCFGTWCGPCRVYSPTFDNVKQQYSESGIEFIELDVDDPENKNLLDKFKIRGVPTTVKVLESGEFKTISGNISENQLKEFINI